MFILHVPWRAWRGCLPFLVCGWWVGGGSTSPTGRDRSREYGVSPAPSGTLRDPTASITRRYLCSDWNEKNTHKIKLKSGIRTSTAYFREIIIILFIRFCLHFTGCEDMKSFLSGHCYPCFWHVVTSALSFSACWILSLAFFILTSWQIPQIYLLSVIPHDCFTTLNSLYHLRLILCNKIVFAHGKTIGTQEEPMHGAGINQPTKSVRVSIEMTLNLSLFILSECKQQAFEFNL